MQSRFGATEKLPFAYVYGNKTSANKIIADEEIKAIATNLMPLSEAWTNLFFMNFFNNIEISNMMMKAGKTTPIVAIAEPKIPPCSLPMKVAMLIAIGPGVTSLKPIISMKWASSIQP